MAKANKSQIVLLVVLIMATLIALFLMNKDKIKIFRSGVNTVINNDQMNQIRENETRIENILQENQKLLQGDEKFLDNLDSYINLPMTEEEYKNFIGTVHNNYPFGNPINEKK